MRRAVCICRLGPVLALALLAAGCTKGGQFDPSEFFSQDMFDTKKRIAGDRKPVFPEGVPGASTGVPPDLMKGYQAPEPPPQATAAVPNAAAAPEPAKPEANPEAKPKPKPAPKPKVVRAPPPAGSVFDQKPAPTTIDIRPAPPAQPTPAPAPAQSAQQGQSVWPDPPPTRPTQNVWPDPPPVSR